MLKQRHKSKTNKKNAVQTSARSKVAMRVSTRRVKCNGVLLAAMKQQVCEVRFLFAGR
jgi:hypothetical protein